jgi:hypothetical protein
LHPSFNSIPFTSIVVTTTAATTAAAAAIRPPPPLFVTLFYSRVKDKPEELYVFLLTIFVQFL